MLKSRIWPAYCTQKHQAKDRSIEFLFTFEDWVNWWEESLGYKWYEKRGRHRGEYVMARFGDKGPYARWNVKCIKHEENIREMAPQRNPQYGEKQGCHKLTAIQVKEIYFSPKSYRELEADYGVTYRVIMGIKKKQMWKTVVDSLPMVELPKHGNRGNTYRHSHHVRKGTGSRLGCL